MTVLSMPSDTTGALAAAPIGVPARSRFVLFCLVGRLLVPLLLHRGLHPGELGLELRLQVPLAEHRHHTRHVVAEILEPRGVVQLPGGQLEPQVEQLLFGAVDAHVQLLVGKLAQLGGFARHVSPPPA
jgi:hypothetical protein